jgi:uncharacterized protein YigA (DUF484 family)
MNHDELAAYLKQHPEFFEQQAALLSQIKLISPHGQRAVSLQERQMETLRDKIKAHELKLAELIRIAHDNTAIENKFTVWTRALLEAPRDVDFAKTLCQKLCEIFDVPQATLRLWEVKDEYAHAWFTENVSDDAHTFAHGLMAPYCGINAAFEVAQWLEKMQEGAHSLAIMPLRMGSNPKAFGLLVLASHDIKRFHAAMATDFLRRLGETASAALSFTQK